MKRILFFTLIFLSAGLMLSSCSKSNNSSTSGSDSSNIVSRVDEQKASGPATNDAEASAETGDNDKPPMLASQDTSDLIASEWELQSLDQEKNELIYHGEYPDGIECTAVLDLVTRALLRQIFPSKWIVIYSYSAMASKASHVPASFVVFADTGGGNPGKMLGSYKLLRTVGQGMGEYRDVNGNTVTVNYRYFDIMPCPN
jgi:hypothetical protein